MKFMDGFIKSAGEPSKHYVLHAVRHVLMRQGVLGIQVKIMLAHDPRGIDGPKMQMPDVVEVIEPKGEETLRPVFADEE